MMRPDRCERFASRVVAPERGVFRESAGAIPLQPRRSGSMAGSSFGGLEINRRNLIRGAGVGAVGLAGVQLLAACSGGGGAGGGGGGGGSASFGSNASDDVPKK